jgi:hypothetical protein
MTFERNPMRRLSLLLAFFILQPARAADEDDAIGKKAKQAKSNYEAKVKKVQDEVERRLKTRQVRAAKTNDKKLSEKIDVERSAFTKSDDWPTLIDARDLKKQRDGARKDVIAAYDALISQCLKEKDKERAESLEKELTGLVGVLPADDQLRRRGPAFTGTSSTRRAARRLSRPRAALRKG